MRATITTPEGCLGYVERAGLCAWRHQPKRAWLPSMELGTPWHGGEMTRQTWFWKDDLHIARRLYFGMLLAPDIPVFVSLSLLPVLIAAQGDIDARTLHEKGLPASDALRVYEYVERHGPTATQALPWSAEETQAARRRSARCLQFRPASLVFASSGQPFLPSMPRIEARNAAGFAHSLKLLPGTARLLL